MKNFLDLLATELRLDISVDGSITSAGLHDHLAFDSNSSVIVDGIEILPKYNYMAVNDTLAINEPFYQWYHRVSGQGWLLSPQ